MDKKLEERTAGSVYKRLNFPAEFKRRLVEQSFEPGASVALIARNNDTNANLLFKWRQHYLAGKYGLPTLLEGAAPKRQPCVPPLLPVDIVAETTEPALPMTLDAAQSLENLCEIEFDPCTLAHSRQRVTGYAAAADSRAIPMIGLSAGTRSWIATGVADVRRARARFGLPEVRQCHAAAGQRCV